MLYYKMLLNTKLITMTYDDNIEGFYFQFEEKEWKCKKEGE